VANGRPLIPQHEMRHRAVQGPWSKYLKYIDRDDEAKLPILYIFRDFELAGIPITAETAGIALKLGRLRHERNKEERARQEQELEEARAASAASLARQKLLEDQPEGIVYYIRRGGLIKIGTTQAFANRMRNLMPDEILAFEPGSYSQENQRHQQFEEHRFGRDRRGSRSEYFYPAPELIDHIRSIRDEYGVPDQEILTITDGRALLDELQSGSG